MRILGKVFHHFVDFVGVPKALLLVLGIVFTSLLGLVEPYFFSKALSFGEVYLHSEKMPNIQEIWSFFGLWGFFIIIYLMMSYVQRYWIADVPALEFNTHFSQEYARKIYSAHIQDALSRKGGSLYRVFDRGINAYFQVVFFVLKDGIKTLTSLMIACGILGIMFPSLTLVALSVAPIIGFIGWRIFQKTLPLQQQNEQKMKDAFGFLGDFFSNIFVAKSLRLERPFSENFVRETTAALKNQKKLSYWWAGLDTITLVGLLLTRILVIGYGVFLIIQKELTFSEFVFVVGYLSLIFAPLGTLLGSFGNLQRWTTEIKTLEEEIDSFQKEAESTGKEKTYFSGNIVFQDVSFGYTKDQKVLDHLSLQIGAGAHIAIIGKTGAGKSTIFNLLLRFWEISAGDIQIDGESIKNISPHSLRSHIGIVTQENSLFHMTIRENLLLAKHDASDEMIKKSLTDASAEFVWDLPNGIDTHIGERGLKLSGGEKQRIALARVFLQDPDIIFLDEATSALDTITEARVQTAIEKLTQGKTTITIAHRLSTIQSADLICVLDGGQIQAIGNFEELREKNHTFSSFLDPHNTLVQF